MYKILITLNVKFVVWGQCKDHCAGNSDEVACRIWLIYKVENKVNLLMKSGAEAESVEGIRGVGRGRRGSQGGRGNQGRRQLDSGDSGA